MNMITYYEQKSGNPVFYSNNGVDYYDFQGNPYAYVRGENWYLYSNGKWLGWQQDKWFYDTNGNPLYYST